jgi:hypothetical protein
MPSIGEEGRVPPPPLGENNNLIVVEDDTESRTSVAPSVEELMKKLEKLNAKLKKLKTRK